MVDGDDSPSSFLQRWSRKKIEGDRQAPDAAQPRATEVSLPDEPAASGHPTEHNDKVPAHAPAKPAFDVASLPSLDSITAATDIRAFLAPGVPKEFVRAALRRAWAADPAIRDFVGLAENAWDFTDLNAMPGFGALPEGYDVKSLVAQIFGESDKPGEGMIAASEHAHRQASHAAEQIGPAAQSEAEAALPKADPDPQRASLGEQQVARREFVHRDNNIAPHNSIPGDEPEEQTRRRQHGTALPQ